MPGAGLWGVLEPSPPRACRGAEHLALDLLLVRWDQTPSSLKEGQEVWRPCVQRSVAAERAPAACAMEVLAPSPGCLCGRREPVSSTLPSSAWSVSSSLIPSGISRLALMHVCPHLLCLAHGSWSFWKFSGLFWSIFPPAFCLSSFWTYCWLSDLLSERCLNFPARRLFSGYPSWRPVVLLALRGLCYRALSFQAPLLPSPSLTFPASVSVSVVHVTGFPHVPVRGPGRLLCAWRVVAAPPAQRPGSRAAWG